MNQNTHPTPCLGDCDAHPAACERCEHPRPAESASASRQEAANLCDGCIQWPCGHHSPIGIAGSITTECANRRPTSGQLISDLRAQLATEQGKCDACHEAVLNHRMPDAPEGFAKRLLGMSMEDREYIASMGAAVMQAEARAKELREYLGKVRRVFFEPGYTGEALVLSDLDAALREATP